MENLIFMFLKPFVYSPTDCRNGEPAEVKGLKPDLTKLYHLIYPLARIPLLCESPGKGP